MTAPELWQATLDGPSVRALAGDLLAAAEVHDVRVKGSARGHALSQTPALADAIDALLGGQVRGVQITYTWSGEGWVDTLLSGSEGFRICRMRQANAQGE